MTVKSVLYGSSLVLAAALGYWAFFAQPDAPPAQPVQTDPIQIGQDSAIQTATVDSRRLDKGAAEGSISDPAWQGWGVEDFSAHARADEAFAARLRQSIGFCSLISNESNPRFNDPRWRMYHRQCAGWPWMQVKEVLSDEGWGDPDLHPDIAAAIKLPEGDPEAKRLAAGVLASSTDKTELQYAYALYFDAHRTRAMVANDMNRGLGLGREEQISFQIDASLYISCQFAAQGCGWNDPVVLVECAATRNCFPGMTMNQIIALRRSPLELELIRLVAEDVAQMRRPP